MITRRKFLVVTTAASLAPVLPAAAIHPKALDKDEMEKIDEDLLRGLASTLVYEVSDLIDIYGGVIDFGIRAVRLADQVLIWSFSKNQEIEHDGEGPKELLPLSDVVGRVHALWWLYGSDENEIPEPDLTLRDVENLPDFTSVVITYNDATRRGA